MNRVARNAVIFPLIGAFAAFMAGCAVVDTGAFTRLQDEMMVLKKEMAVLKTAPPPAPVPAADVGEIQSLRKSFADSNSDFDRVRTDQLAATTRMDEARVEMQRITARQDAQDRALQEIRGNADRMKEIEKRLAALEERIGKLAAAPAAAAPAPESPREWRSPEEMYEVAVGQVKGGNPKKGRETLSDFAAKYPGHKLIPNALYWKGEAFYAEKDFENAILTFQDVVDKYPRGEKAPDAMYKQGLSFLSLKDKKNARILLELVPKKYPKSKAAEMAKKKIKEIR
ncbi:MAG TPA: tol-pal system protein YbgF [Terriglobales bacterium]|nr:tol-pal system protein YbgF [Terriglobales bacterium]